MLKVVPLVKQAMKDGDNSFMEITEVQAKLYISQGAEVVYAFKQGNRFYEAKELPVLVFDVTDNDGEEVRVSNSLPRL